MKKKIRGASILCKTIFMNFFNIIRYYPKMVYMAFHQDKYTDDQMYDYGIKLIKLAIDTSNFKIETYGLDNIPESDGLYICSNHQEKFDPLVIWYTFPRQVGVILRDKVTHRPFIREVCRLIKSKKLKNDGRAVVKLYSEITDDLKNGLNYMIFPEGGYEDNYRKLSQFHPGSFKSAQRARCPIVPVTIIDSYRIFDKGMKTTRPIQVRYLKPVQPAEYSGMSTAEIAQLVEKRIQDELSKFQE